MALVIGIPAGIAMAVWRGGMVERATVRLRAGRAEPADLLVRRPADPAVRRDAALAADIGRGWGSASLIMPSVALGRTWRCPPSPA